MPPSTRSSPAAQEPTDLYAIIQDAVNAADVEAFLGAHDDDATVVTPPEGAIARGHAQIRAAIVALLRLRPRLTLVPGAALRGGELALAHGRWHLSVDDDGSRIELGGLGTMVTRRGPDGMWRVVLDDPLTGP